MLIHRRRDIKDAIGVACLRIANFGQAEGSEASLDESNLRWTAEHNVIEANIHRAASMMDIIVERNTHSRKLTGRTIEILGSFVVFEQSVPRKSSVTTDDAHDIDFIEIPSALFLESPTSHLLTLIATWSVPNLTIDGCRSAQALSGPLLPRVIG